MYQILLNVLQKLVSDLVLLLLRGGLGYAKKTIHGHGNKDVSKMTDFECALNYVLDREGGLVENADDPGGITNFGISYRFLKSLATEKLALYGIYEEVSEQT